MNDKTKKHVRAFIREVLNEVKQNTRNSINKMRY